ncbi:MAG: class SAM-dependent methyltransferase [Cyanobacteria bacterium RYN_339]|nr:class SAM-dependent methyltransferase [Cyanobacteria bacterium RYN_339]
MNKHLWRGWYAFLAWYADRQGASFSCMNWGYDDGRETVEAAAGPERFPLQLYQALVESTPLDGKVVLDASCGRGGGLHYLAVRHGPAAAIGLDFTGANIKLCQRSFGNSAAPISFRQGDAERMQGVEDGSVDVALSVEASHCYPRIDAFLATSARVLRPGGHLLWTDFVPTESVPELRAQLAPHFELVEDRDITPHVLAAMRADRGRRRDLVEQHSAPFLRPILLNFAAADDRCDTVERFTSGRFTYFMFKARRRDS